MNFGLQTSDQLTGTVSDFRVQMMLRCGLPQNHTDFAQEKRSLKHCINGTLRQENITILISETLYKNS